MNLRVMQRELDYPAEHMLVSTPDNKGIMTHCNRAFVAVSGYSFKELICQNHNMLRQSDMPEIAFKDRLSTIGRNNPRTVAWVLLTMLGPIPEFFSLRGAAGLTVLQC